MAGADGPLHPAGQGHADAAGIGDMTRCVIIALFEAIWPLLIPIETLAPPPQAELVEAIWTFQAPSKLAAAAGVVTEAAASNRMRAAMIVLLRLGMAFPFVST